jgi:metallophosphoesterase (TIGR03767 family)
MSRIRSGVRLPSRLWRRLGRRRFLIGAGYLGAGAALASLIGCREGEDEALTTLDRTIAWGEDGSLTIGPGEPYEVRTGLADAHPGREETRRSFVVFHHFSDLQLLDEESPLRGEWQDSCPEPIATSAYRPQETLTLQAAASLVRAANRVNRSPVSNRAVDFVIQTGNAIDNAQFNELRWFIDTMDGLIVDPDSGGPGYEGVQTESPDQRYPELLSQAQMGFMSPGLRYPWYAVLGNRDLLAQGNFPPDEASRQTAIGDSKVIDLSPERKEEVCADPSILLDPALTEEIFADEGTDVRTVTADGDRRLLSRKEWMEQLFQTNLRPGPVGHGLSEGNLEKDVAYYVLEHGPISFIVLDTVNPQGFSAGSIDAKQFKWLEERLKNRSSAYFNESGAPVENDVKDRLMVVVSHHNRDSLNSPIPDASGEPGMTGADLEALLHRYPNVICHLAGHSRAHEIAERPDPDRRGGAYWEIGTAPPVAYPMQGRMLEVADNGDGTLSIFTTMFNMSAPVDPGKAEDQTTPDDVNEEQLASLARSIAAQDPQRDPEAAGLAASSRNAELLLNAPFDLSAVGVPARHSVSPPETRKLGRRALLRLRG